MIKKMIFIIGMILTALMLLLGGCAHKHQFEEANCTEPMRCIKCGETEGEALGHSFKPATCTSPRTCERCGTTAGKAPGHDWKTATTNEPRTCRVCGETEGECLKVSVSDWESRNIAYISDEYLMIANEDGKWTLVDYNGNKINKDKFSEDIGTEWDILTVNRQDGCFILRTDNSDGTYSSWLVDRNLNVLVNYKETDGYMADLRDDVLIAYYPEKNMVVYYPYSAGSPLNYAKGISVSMDGKKEMFSQSHGYVQYTNADKNDSIQGLLSLQFKDNELSEIRDKTYMVGDEYIYFIDNNVNDEGWIAADLGTYTTTETGNKFNYDKVGIFNVETEEFLELPETQSLEYQSAENGCSRCAVYGDRMVLSNRTVNSDNGTTELFLPYNWKKQKFETYRYYYYIELSPHKLLLAQNEAGNWGYLDSSNCYHVGEWYDDACRFCNGYAMVHKDGHEYVINEDMEIVSGPIDGDYTKGNNIKQDWFTFNESETKPVFFVKNGDNYRVVTVG